MSITAKYQRLPQTTLDALKARPALVSLFLLEHNREVATTRERWLVDAFARRGVGTKT